MLFSTPDCVPTSNALIKLWMHEAFRVYADKLVEEKDIKNFNGLITEFVQKGIYLFVYLLRKTYKNKKCSFMFSLNFVVSEISRVRVDKENVDCDVWSSIDLSFGEYLYLILIGFC